MSHFDVKCLACVLTLILSACSGPQRTADGTNGPQRGEDASASATFYVYNGDGDGRIGAVIGNSKWRIPSIANFSFVACMDDAATASQARGQKFEIEIPETGVRLFPQGPSDDRGCITWQESVPFNYFARRSAPILIKRKIVGTGIHSGFYTVSYAIDPWATDKVRDQIKPVQYLKQLAPPPHMILDTQEAKKALAADGDGADIWINQLDIKVVNRLDLAVGSQVEYQLVMKPFIQWLNNDGVPQPIELTTGEFEVYAHLVASETGPARNMKTILTSGEMSSFAPVRNKELLVTLKTTLNRDVPMANLVLVIKLVPRGLSQSLKEYVGIFELGDIHDAKTGVLAQSCVIEDKSSCSMKYLEGADNFAALRKESYAFPRRRLSFNGLKLRFVQVATTPPETATRRTINYSVSTCVTDRYTGAKVANMPFHIDYVDASGNIEDPAKSQTAITDDEGCLRWLAQISHQYYKPEHFFLKNVKLTMGETQSGSTLSFILNPWDDKFTFGFDTREVNEDFVSDVSRDCDPDRDESCNRIPSRFFTAGYGYHTLRLLYSFDEFLDLEVKKTILLEVDPRVLRYSGIVNARRTTEGLRDGIYLLKVAIEKSYLDPSTQGVRIFVDPKDPQHVRSTIMPSREDPDYIRVPKQEFVTTATALVRVVNGVLLKPIELTMRDLRLMRMRTNFLFELQTVDEQKLAANDVLQREYFRQLEEYRDQFKLSQEELKSGKVPLAPEQVDKKVEEREAQTQSEMKKIWSDISRMLDGQKLREQGQPINISDYQIPGNLYDSISRVLGYNDFTTTRLPSCQDTDCSRFIEKHSGLKPRTFVGPVIFLDYSHSDAVRPTDNLDEACKRPDNPYLSKEEKRRIAFGKEHVDYQIGPEGEEDWFSRRLKEEEGSRRNRYYIYSNYFGALTHLCDPDDRSIDEDVDSDPKHGVDRLIEIEAKQTAAFRDNVPKLATLENFVQRANADFAVLTQENFDEYKSADNRVSVAEILKALNENLGNRMLRHPEFREADLKETLLGSGDFNLNTDDSDRDFELNRDQVTAICSLLTNRVMSQINGSKWNVDRPGLLNPRSWMTTGASAPFVHSKLFATTIFDRCRLRKAGVEPGLVLEEPVRIFETGSNYKFKGGLQMNVNVGDSFSVSSKGAITKGIEVSDVATSIVGVGGLLLGGPLGTTGVVGALLIHLIRPLSGKGQIALEDSDGTFVGGQTYLVSQIAKFDVELKKYEVCRIFRLNQAILNSDFYIDFGGLDPNVRNDKGRTLAQEVTRGLVVCQGHAIENRVLVPENYFYLTQHFTEGDMLDQADLLNNPWLFPLRGERDFAVFMHSIRAQEAFGIRDLGTGTERRPSTRPIDWPLEQMANVYNQRAPSFPGIFQVLRKQERISAYPLNDRIITVGSDDINAEQCNRKEGCAGLRLTSPPVNRSFTPYPDGAGVK